MKQRFCRDIEYLDCSKIAEAPCQAIAWILVELGLRLLVCLAESLLEAFMTQRSGDPIQILPKYSTRAFVTWETRPKLILRV